jgi:integrase/recombinase XerC
MQVHPDDPVMLFLHYLQFERRFSLHTVSAYREDLGFFHQFMEATYPGVPFMETRAAFVRSWMADMAFRKLAAKTINRRLSALKSFYRFQQKQGWSGTNPAIGVKMLKIPHRLPGYLETSQLEQLKLLEGLPEEAGFAPGFEGLRDRLILSILYHTGIRVGELVALREGHIDFSLQSLKVLGKGNKERIIPLARPLLDQVRRYLEARAAEREQPSGPEAKLLPLHKGKETNARMVYSIVRKHLSTITTQPKKSPHVLRHSFATHLARNGAALHAIKELLGHSSLAATQVYTHHSLEKLKEIHAQAHPRGDQPEA